MVTPNDILEAKKTIATVVSFLNAVLFLSYAISAKHMPFAHEALYCFVLIGMFALNAMCLREKNLKDFPKVLLIKAIFTGLFFAVLLFIIMFASVFLIVIFCSYYCLK